MIVIEYRVISCSGWRDDCTWFRDVARAKTGSFAHL